MSIVMRLIPASIAAMPLASERKNMPAAIASSENANVLLVGEDSAFLRAGGMIDLVLDKGKVQFEIAHDAIERSNIRQLRVKISPEYPTIARKMNSRGRCSSKH
jgi:YfiR/HmsC-like